MERKQLEDLGITDDNAIKSIMKINGDDIETAKTNTKQEVQKNIDDVQTKLDDANKKIESFKDLDPEKIKKEADEWKIKAEQFAKEKENLEKKSIARDLFRNAKDDLSLNALTNEFLAKELKFENGKFIGADEVKKEFQDKYSNHFKSSTETPPPLNPNPNNLGKDGFNLNGSGNLGNAKKSIKEELFG